MGLSAKLYRGPGKGPSNSQGHILQGDRGKHIRCVNCYRKGHAASVKWTRVSKKSIKVIK